MGLRPIRLSADRARMKRVMREPRTRVMISVDASWEDPGGTLQSVSARIENKSVGGACIRIGTPVAVGSKLGIRCRWEQFSGIAKYCVGDDGGYLVGIQRDASNRTTLDQLVSTAVPQRGGVRSGDPPVSTAKVPNPQERQQSKRSRTAVAEGKPSKESIPRTAGRTAATPPPWTRDETESKGSPPEFDGPVRVELQTRQLSKLSLIHI